MVVFDKTIHNVFAPKKHFALARGRFISTCA
eukprot:Gb_35360 [translate_table: standard]